MAHSRFIKDTGLTVRMTTVMFLLGGLFVALIVAMIYLMPPQYAPFIGLIGIGIAVYQWWNSDKAAMKAMRAYEVTPEEYPSCTAPSTGSAPWPRCPNRGSGSARWTFPTRSPPGGRPTGRWSV